MVKLIQASDTEVLARTVPLSTPAEALPPIAEGERSRSRASSLRTTGLST
jgi:hypothetical protein